VKFLLSLTRPNIIFNKVSDIKYIFLGNVFAEFYHHPDFDTVINLKSLFNDDVLSYIWPRFKG